MHILHIQIYMLALSKKTRNRTAFPVLHTFLCVAFHYFDLHSSKSMNIIHHLNYDQYKNHNKNNVLRIEF